MSAVLPSDVHRFIFGTPKEPEALSDQIRIELLSRYGGVWVDATTLCAVPLDEWLHRYMRSGFFAFDRPTHDRMLASWFIASMRGNYITQQWRNATREYWNQRQTRDDYFWFHKLFAALYARDLYFRACWDETPKLPAAHPAHFGPNDTRLTEQATDEQIALISSPPAPVFKVSHKLPPARQDGALIDELCAFARGGGIDATLVPASRRRLLVTWYGSFEKHGTIGDLRSLETLVTHLVARGHNVCHATAIEFDIPGSRRICLQDAEPASFEAVLFVCGPVLRFHPQTAPLLERCKVRPLIGVGVSLLPRHHPHHANPFHIALAREGERERFGDLAILAPLQVKLRQSGDAMRIGIALRGAQSDYGNQLCLWRETEAIVFRVASSLMRHRDRIVWLENHLDKSGMVPDEIEEAYSECNLIITSRFHGAITALRLGIPFIAIDQIKGGAKVFNLVSQTGWRHVYRIDETDESQLCSAASALLREPCRSNLMRAYGNASAAANRTLSQLDACLDNLHSATISE